MNTYLVVGLGNVGCKYDNTYHNIGFDVANNLISKYEIQRKKELTYVSLTWLNIEGRLVIVAKPKTYMNLSGTAVRNVCNSYKINYKNIIVALDDLDLPKGSFRYKQSGSGGSHNGLKNIVEVLDTKDFARVRVGFGPKPEKMPLDKFVLSHITKEDRLLINPAIEQATQKIIDFILGNIK